MDAALAASALFMGLTGSLHCASMCGPAFGAIAARSAPGGFSGTTLSMHAGRLLSYSAAGALVASSTSALGTLQAAGPLLRPVWTLIHVAAIALGLALVWKGRAPRWLTRRLTSDSRQITAPANAHVIRIFTRLPPSGRAGMAGMCWAGIPCGLLQSALLVAALSSGPLGGATVMSTFAIASGVGLWAGPYLWARIGTAPGDERWTRLAARLAGARLVVSSGFALWHGLGAILAQICGVPGSGT
jgi:sulfite exporter TauE/SafE